MTWRTVATKCCIVGAIVLGLSGCSRGDAGATTVKLLQQGRPAEAVPFALEAVRQAEEAHGRDHPDTATHLQRLADAYRLSGNAALALPVYQRALAIREEVLGRYHPETATTLNNLGVLYQVMGRQQEAVPLYERALLIREKTAGPDAAETAAAAGNLAGAYLSTNRGGQALPLFQRALAHDERTLGADHPNTAADLNNLATTYQSLGRGDDALAVYRRAFAIQDRVLGPDHPQTARTLNNLAVLFYSLGRYDEALPLYRRALETRQRVFGADHPETVASVDALGLLYRAMDLNAEALQQLQRVLAVRERTLGPDDTAVAASLGHVADVYHRTARYRDALPLYLRALAIRERIDGPDALSTGRSLSEVASVYESLGDYEQALPLKKRALAIREAQRGPDDPDTAASLSDLALLYALMRRYDAALPLQQRALAIDEKALGPDNAKLGTILNVLAYIQEGRGRAAEALPLRLRSLAINERTYGPDHPVTAGSLNNLAAFYRDTGRYAEALPLMRRAVRIVATSDATDYRKQSSSIFTLAFSAGNLAHLLEHHGRSDQVDEAIFYYKLSVNARQRLRAGAIGLDKPLRDAQTATLADAYQGLAALLVRQGRIAEAEHVLLMLKESELTDFVRRNGADRTTSDPARWTPEEQQYWKSLSDAAEQWQAFGRAWSDISVRIRRGEIAESDAAQNDLLAQRVRLETRIANVMDDAARRFTDASRDAAQRRAKSVERARTGLSQVLQNIRTHQEGGVAPVTVGLVLLPGPKEVTIVVTTETGAVPLASRIAEADLNALVKRLRDAIDRRGDYQEAAQMLYRLLIEPADRQLEASKQADFGQFAILAYGSLRDLPFAALRRPSDHRHLIELHAVTMLTADGNGGFTDLEVIPKPHWVGAALGTSRPDPAFGNVGLPGVRNEVCGIARDGDEEACLHVAGLMAGQRYLDERFTREALRRLLGPGGDGGPNFLHIATHYDVADARLLLGKGSALTTESILSWSPRAGQYDLVALSACSSGIDQAGVESLGGLFRSRGAKSVVATLWPVADVGAAPLMVEFYRQVGEQKKLTKGQALQNAQLKMLRGDVKDESGRADLRHPYFWAPYILMGNWL